MSFKTYFAVFALIVFASIIAPAAHALDVGQCASLEAITNSLKTEGQHSFASATRLTQENEGISKERTLLGILITANDAGSLGYILQTDKPLGDGATQACVSSRMANMRFYDARKPGLVDAVLSKASAADAKKACAAMMKTGDVTADTCDDLNAYLRRGDAVGQRAIAQGQNLRKQRDGSYALDNVLITVTANLANGDSARHGIGSLFNSTPQGAAVMRFTLHAVAYTPGGEQRLRAEALRAR